MARPTLFTHRKFRALTRILGSKALAVGTLELLWAVANDSGDALLGSAEDVEMAADWHGEPHALVDALVRCQFLDKSRKGYSVHDLWHHAPDYVIRRRQREQNRRDKGVDVSELRRQAALTRWRKRDVQTDANGMQLDAPVMHVDATPISHLPTPITQERERGADAPQSTRVFQELWNTTTTPPIPRCRDLTTQRRKKMLARLKDRPLEAWRDVFQRIEASRFCRGQNDRNWRASFDWIVENQDNAVKVLEGKYDDVDQALSEPVWAVECREIHSPRCPHEQYHRHRMAKDGAA